MAKKPKRSYILPTGSKVRCSECNELHELDVTGPRSQAPLSYYCPNIRDRMCPLSKEGQAAIRKRVVDGDFNEIERVRSKMRTSEDCDFDICPTIREEDPSVPDEIPSVPDEIVVKPDTQVMPNITKLDKVIGDLKKQYRIRR